MTERAKSCADCRFCGTMLGPNQEIMMVCRKNPPTVGASVFPAGGQLMVQTTTSWPRVYDHDWCGEFSKQAILS